MINVLKKDGHSYVELKPSLSYRINGEPLQACPGNASWSMVQGDVISIEAINRPGRELAGYRLHDQYVSLASEQLPLERPAGYFEWGDDGWEGPHANLYQTIYRDVPREVTPCEFRVLDYDCAPVEMPSYVSVDFPSNLKYPEAVQHKYPCRVSVKDVYRLVADAIIAEAATYRDQRHRVKDLRNIEVLTVEVWVGQAPEENPPECLHGQAAEVADHHGRGATG